MTASICSICKKEFPGYGNNADPVNNGRCCDECNETTVFWTRLKFRNARLLAIGAAIYLASMAVLCIAPAHASIGDAIRMYPVQPASPPVTCRFDGNAIYCG